MKVAFVTPRYGDMVIGGAEAGTRQLAERLGAKAGFEVEVLTTCATDHITWDDELPAGETFEEGVRVRRFSSEWGRRREFYELDGRVRVSPKGATAEQAKRWVELNGPVSSGLLEAVRQSEADVMSFYPYLYHPIVAGITLARCAKVLHPAAHDEPALYLPVFRETFSAADALCYHTDSERRLVQRVHQVAQQPQMILGLGIEVPAGTDGAGRRALGLDDRPYLVSVGRVDEHKGSSMLAEFFARFKKRHGGPLALVMVGPQAAKIEPHPDVIFTGVVSDQQRSDIVGDATVAVSPSAMESLSLVVLEAWAQRVPVLVNAGCEVTVAHAKSSEGGLWFGSYGEFEVAIERLLSDDRLRNSLAGNGLRYVDGHYRWPSVIERYSRFLTHLASRIRSVSSQYRSTIVSQLKASSA